VLSFDFNATIEYGMIRSNLEKKGIPIGPLDLLIAAHAKSLNYTLVTNNEKEFSRIEGLKIENWV
jgi:tRNA(fMet)-specific endonuclease VapC